MLPERTRIPALVGLRKFSSFTVQLERERNTDVSDSDEMVGCTPLWRPFSKRKYVVVRSFLQLSFRLCATSSWSSPMSFMVDRIPSSIWATISEQNTEDPLGIPWGSAETSTSVLASCCYLRVDKMLCQSCFSITRRPAVSHNLGSPNSKCRITREHPFKKRRSFFFEEWMLYTSTAICHLGLTWVILERLSHNEPLWMGLQRVEPLQKISIETALISSICPLFLLLFSDYSGTELSRSCGEMKPVSSTNKQTPRLQTSTKGPS